jgi:predicted  nucleic acid-binding Zn-ribbon protein
MEDQSMESYLIGRKPEKKQAAGPSGGKGSKISEALKVGLLIALIVAVGYLIYDGYIYKQVTAATLAQMSDQILVLENLSKAGEAKITNLAGEIDNTQKAVGSTKAELRKTAQQLETKTDQAKSELTDAISRKADTTEVMAFKQEAETKIGEVTSTLNGVQSEVGTVSTDLKGTKQDLRGTQRELVDVREALTSAVAKNAEELAVLRRKGQRDYFEFTLPKKNQVVKIEDIRLILKKTDHKKGKYTIQVLVDDSKLEKKDKTLNEPIQFLVGRNRLRYEIVVNWLEKNRAGGYLSIPKDKTLASERTVTN